MAYRSRRAYRGYPASSRYYPRKTKFGSRKKRAAGTKKYRALTKGVSKSEVLAIMKQVMRGSRKKVQLRGVPDNLLVFAGPALGPYCYGRLPVTQAIPQQRGAENDADSRWRGGDKVHIKGVSIRARISFSAPVEMMAVLYPAKVQDEEIAVDGNPPDRFNIGRSQKDAPGGHRLLSLIETNMQNDSKEGPFAVVPGVNGTLFMDSPDRSLFNCRLSSGPGAPIGAVRWKKDADLDSKDYVTGQTYHQEFRPTISCISGQRDSRAVQIYFEVNKEVEFLSAGSSSLVFSPHYEIMLGVRGMECGMLRDDGLDLRKANVGVLSNLMVDVYYS
jgi:hypothetical protein